MELPTYLTKGRSFIAGESGAADPAWGGNEILFIQGQIPHSE